MPSKRYSVEPIVAELRAERLRAQGQTIAQVPLRWTVATRRGRRPAAFHVDPVLTRRRRDGRHDTELAADQAPRDPEHVDGAEIASRYDFEQA